MPSAPIYSLHVAEVYPALETFPQGLPAEEIQARHSLYGSNQLSEQPGAPAWRKLLAHGTHPMALLLWLAGIVAFSVGDPILGLIIWSVVLVNAGFSYWREHRAEQAITALRQLLPGYARVMRDGLEFKVPSSELVPGDLLILAEGDNIPADARVVEEYGLRVNNATLTGEAVPARKTAEASLREGISELERPNLVFAGTSVVSGTARAVIYATGMLTQFGRLARLTQAVHEAPSLLQKDLLFITRRLAFIALGLGAIVFSVGILEVGLSLPTAFLLAIGIIVAALPEGLPATVTLSLAMGVQRLASQGVLVKKLAIIETLGTVSVICTDKSGTLTQNQMTVQRIWVSGQEITVTGVGYEPRGEFIPDPNIEGIQPDLQALLYAATSCNNARLTPPSTETPHWSCLGDQTEAALRVAALKGGITAEQANQTYPRIHELPFEARRKRMSTVHRLSRADPSFPGSQRGQSVAFVKGAPREMLQLCTHILWNQQVLPLEESMRAEILAANDRYARSALRVLALARRDLPQRAGGFTVDRIESGLTLLAMMDPPRPGVSEAVKRLQGAGVRLVMITGDYGLTAESLARRVGMLQTDSPRLMTGAEVEVLNEFELQKILQEEVVFARMAPEHKLRLVSALQASGEVVVVTGDGVNDAPALRKADVGIAMGVTGTDVAKEAADIILTNDHFPDIAAAIEEGRAVFDNLRKFITYIFSSNVAEILPFLLTALLSPQVLPLAMGVKQILAVDLGTDIFPALALGAEKPEPDVMLRPPRRRTQSLIDSSLLSRAFLWLGLIEAVLCYLGFFFVLYGGSIPYVSQLHQALFSQLAGLTSTELNQLAVTVFYAGVVMAQVGNAFACRTERHRGRTLGWLSNPQLLLGIGIELLILLVLIYLPPLARLFEHVPIPLLLWPGLASYALVIYSLDWMRKWLLRWRENPANLNLTPIKRKEVL
jgi:magnesium-transporting ATPase (P-type)